VSGRWWRAYAKAARRLIDMEVRFLREARGVRDACAAWDACKAAAIEAAGGIG